MSIIELVKAPIHDSEEQSAEGKRLTTDEQITLSKQLHQETQTFVDSILGTKSESADRSGERVISTTEGSYKIGRQASKDHEDTNITFVPHDPEGISVQLSAYNDTYGLGPGFRMVTQQGEEQQQAMFDPNFSPDLTPGADEKAYGDCANFLAAVQSDLLEVTSGAESAAPTPLAA